MPSWATFLILHYVMNFSPSPWKRTSSSLERAQPFSLEMKIAIFNTNILGVVLTTRQVRFPYCTVTVQMLTRGGCEAPDHKRQQGYHLEKFQHQRVSVGAARERNTAGASLPVRRRSRLTQSLPKTVKRWLRAGSVGSAAYSLAPFVPGGLKHLSLCQSLAPRPWPPTGPYTGLPGDRPR